MISHASNLFRFWLPNDTARFGLGVRMLSICIPPVTRALTLSRMQFMIFLFS